jgi:hypothetical protein
MAAGNWRFSASPRFETGQVFESITVADRRAIVAEVRRDGREALVRFVDGRGQRFREEEWVLADIFLAEGGWKRPSPA